MFYIKGSFYIKGCDKACPQLSLLSTIFVFRADPSSEMAALASICWTFLLRNQWMDFDETG